MRLEDRFTITELEQAILALDDDGIERSISGETAWCCTGWRRRTTARRSPTSVPLSERVLFPSGPTESHGMEDARFVRFLDDDRRSLLQGPTPRSTVIRSCRSCSRTTDFAEFRVATLTGKAAHSQGAGEFSLVDRQEVVARLAHDNVNNVSVGATIGDQLAARRYCQEPKRRTVQPATAAPRSRPKPAGW
ncbi:MAG: hypothetical protein R2705_14315 [Ilumatobacteraceae bacterium]